MGQAFELDLGMVPQAGIDAFGVVEAIRVDGHDQRANVRAQPRLKRRALLRWQKWATGQTSAAATCYAAFSEPDR